MNILTNHLARSLVCALADLKGLSVMSCLLVSTLSNNVDLTTHIILAHLFILGLFCLSTISFLLETASLKMSRVIARLLFIFVHNRVENNDAMKN